MLNEKIFAIVLKRKTGKLLLCSPDGSFMEYVHESRLNEHEIHLGDCCTFDLIDGYPVHFQKTEISVKLGDDTKIEKERNEVVIINVLGKLKNILMTELYYFETENFGKVAFFGKKEDLKVGVNAECKISLKIIDEGNSNPSFSKNFKWSGTIQNEHRVIGLVVAENDKNKYVWVKGTFPGKDGIIPRSDKIPIGTWIEMIFSNDQFQRFFPNKPSELTPRFKAGKFKILSSDDLPVARRSGNNVVVHLEKFEVSTTHYTGKDIDHLMFGLISDVKNLIVEGDGEYNVSIAKTFPTAGKSGKQTVWKIIKANKKFTKLAVVFSIGSTDSGTGGSNYYLWLMNDHITSVYFTKKALPEFEIGHIFEGTFEKSTNKFHKFTCLYHGEEQNIDDFTTSVCNNRLEITVTIYTRTLGTLTVFTYHKFLGQIMDKYELLPKDCSNGVKVLVASVKSEDEERVWNVKKVLEKFS